MIAFEMLERGGEVMTKVVPGVSRNTLQPIIAENVEVGSTVHTDELRSYGGFGEGRIHTRGGQSWSQGVHQRRLSRQRSWGILGSSEAVDPIQRIRPWDSRSGVEEAATEVRERV